MARRLTTLLTFDAMACVYVGYPSAALQHVSRMLRAAWPSKHDSGSLTTCRGRIRAIQNSAPCRSAFAAASYVGSSGAPSAFSTRDNRVPLLVRSLESSSSRATYL